MKKRVHPAWKTVVQVFFILFSLYAIIYNTTNLFIDPVSTDLGVSRTAINLIITIRSIGSLITLAISGYFFKRFGIKSMLVVGAIGTAATLFLSSLASNISSLYLCYFIMGLSMGYISDLSCSIILNNWFNEKTALANGIAATGSGLGGALFSSLSGFIIGSFGWRHAYRFLAIAGFTIAILAISRIAVYPSQVGMQPYGSTSKTREVSQKGVLLKDIKSNPLFWQMVVCTVLISYSFFIVTIGYPAHLLDMGYSIELTGTISALMLIIMSAMKIVLGYMYDEIGTSKTVLFVCILLILGLISVIFIENKVFLALSVFCFATGTANIAQSLQCVTRNLFGRKDYGQILRIFMIGSNGGGLICPILSGLAYDAFGSYTPLYKILLIPAVILLIANQRVVGQVKKEITCQFK